MSKDFCDHYSTTPKDLFFLPNLVDNTLYSKAHTCTIEEKNTLKKKWKIEKNVSSYLLDYPKKKV